jgi:hypothetical protein
MSNLLLIAMAMPMSTESNVRKQSLFINQIIETLDSPVGIVVGNQ